MTEAPSPSPVFTRSRGALLAASLGAVAVFALAGGRPHPHPLALRRLPPIREQVKSALAAAPPPAATTAPVAKRRVVPPAPTSATPPRFAEAVDVSTFHKGNIHTHTTWSDGDRPPEDVYLWYRERGYAFLAITDHNTLTDPAIFRLLERKKRFVMITGEEVTMWGGGKQVHVNGLCTKSTIGGKKFDTQREALAWGVARVKEQGGVALVNHPNWDWALGADDLSAARGARFLEIWSGHPHVHTLGDETRPSHEALWDTMITEGEDFAGSAADDAHAYGKNAPENAARPGRAWVFAFAPELTRAAICAALAEGKIYSSTGPSLKRILVKDDEYAVYPADRRADIEFVGWGGALLQSGKAGDDGAARYKLTGSEGYVRARIKLDGKHAWTMPSRLAR